MEVVDQTNRPDRKVYRITSAGRAALRQWLIAPHTAKGNRNALMIQIFFAGQLGDEEVLPIFEHIAEQLRAGLAVYDAISQQSDAYQEYTDSPREFYFWMLKVVEGLPTRPGGGGLRFALHGRSRLPGRAVVACILHGNPRGNWLQALQAGARIEERALCARVELGAALAAPRVAHVRAGQFARAARAADDLPPLHQLQGARPLGLVRARTRTGRPRRPRRLWVVVLIPALSVLAV